MPSGARMFLRGPGCSGVWMPWRKTWCSGGLDSLKKILVPWADGMAWGSGRPEGSPGALGGFGCSVCLDALKESWCPGGMVCSGALGVLGDTAALWGRVQPPKQMQKHQNHLIPNKSPVSSQRRWMLCVSDPDS